MFPGILDLLECFLVMLDLRGCYFIIGVLCVDGVKPPVACFTYGVSVLVSHLKMNPISHSIFLVKCTSVDGLLNWSMDPIMASTELALWIRI
jgi:hypothetical protein